MGQPRYQYAGWVGDSGASLVVVHEANLYLMPSPSDTPIVLTDDALPDLFYNGVPDLLYEGERERERVMEELARIHKG